jgi:hypothetical protein
MVQGYLPITKVITSPNQGAAFRRGHISVIIVGRGILVLLERLCYNPFGRIQAARHTIHTNVLHHFYDHRFTDNCRIQDRYVTQLFEGVIMKKSELWLGDQRFSAGEFFDHFHAKRAPDVHAWLARQDSSMSNP